MFSTAAHDARLLQTALEDSDFNLGGLSFAIPTEAAMRYWLHKHSLKS